MRYCCTCLLVLSIVLLTVAKQTQYTAAVVEHALVVPKTLRMNRTMAVELMRANLNEYDGLIAEAKRQSAQIIVFPEDGLYSPSFVTRDGIFPFLEPIPENGAIPCLNPTPETITVSYASCLARKHKIVLVINMGDIVKSEKSPDGRFQYNTQVAFDEEGRILQKYHKSHLYHEPQFDAGDGLPKTFEAFGVRFGMMICFDIMFDTPSKALFREGVTDIVYSTWWVNFSPIINAIQVQQGFSHDKNINLIAANPGIGFVSSGTGIYNRGKALTSFYNPTKNPMTKLLVANVTTSTSPLKDTVDIEETRSPEIPPAMSFTAFVPEAFHDYEFIQHAGVLTCHFKCSVRNATDDVYAAFALSGFGFPLFPQEICGLFKCGTSKKDCERVIQQLRDKEGTAAHTIFDTFEIHMKGNIQGNTMLPLVFGVGDQLYSSDFEGDVKTSWSENRDSYHLIGRGRDKVLHSAILFSLVH